MAYMSQDRKKQIKEALKEVVPMDWKWSLSVDNHSTLVLTVQNAPINLLEMLSDKYGYQKAAGYADVNTYYLKSAFENYEEIGDIFSSILDVMNGGNHDNSDSVTDYFDVGWYNTIRLGKYDKPFAVKE